MNADQFNEKWKDFLEKGHYGMAIDNPEVNNFMNKKFEQWSKIPGFCYAQIKTKFNWACVYVSNVGMDELTEAETFIARELKLRDN